MRILTIYARVLAGLRQEWRLGVVLSVANIAVAGLQFLDPILFGRVIQMLAGSDRMSPAALWTQASTLLGIWAGVGARRHRSPTSSPPCRPSGSPTATGCSP